jgi:hypothetical protein
MTPLPDTALLKEVEHVLKSNFVLRSADEFPFSNPTVLKAYGIEHATENPSVAFESWAQLVADLDFRLPPLYLALVGSRSKVLVYECQATNPYPKASFFYGRANHGINDLLLFNIGADMVPQEHKTAWEGAVNQLQEAWLEFCNGSLPWAPLKGVYSAKEEDYGPMFVIANGGAGGLKGTVREGIGERDWNRWQSLLDASRGRD